MEAVSRKPFQGSRNILRFNRQFYGGVVVLLAALYLLRWCLPGLHFYVVIAGLLLLVVTGLSLLVSLYVYDLSGLYGLDWLPVDVRPGGRLVNIHAGFDETTALLAKKYPQASLTVFDFYDPQKHTEVSIRRARKAYPAYPGTEAISTDAVPLAENSVDFIVCILSAHEIRDAEERSLFFQQLRKALKKEGRIIVAEHLQDLPNFLAYSVGALHFHSAAAWKQTFSAAGLLVEKSRKFTPFITVYSLQKNGNPS